MVFDQTFFDKVQLYQGTGYWGLLDFAGGAMTGIELTRLKETDGIGQAAGPIVLQAILDAGGTEGVDGVSGATVTSSAIIAATDMAFEKASGAQYLADYEAVQTAE